MDEIDQANAHAEFMLELKLREHMAPKEYGRAECDDCDEPVHEERRKMGFSVCVDCAWEREVREKTVGRPV